MSTESHKPSSSQPPTEFACPQCKKIVVWNDAAKYRPFCSHRCQLIDLGEWANESYRVPDTNSNITEDDLWSEDLNH